MRYRKLRMVTAGVLGAMLLLSGCEPASVKQDETLVIPYDEEELALKVPDNFEGEGATFTLAPPNMEQKSKVALQSVTLHCSDDVDRTSYAVSNNMTLLGGKKQDDKTADGVISVAENLTLYGQVGLTQGSGVGAIMTGVVAEQAVDYGKGDTLLISNIVPLDENTFLMEVITGHENRFVDSFCVLDYHSADIVQMYLLTRTYEKVEAEDINPDNISDLLRYCRSSDEIREIFIDVLRALIERL
ncbi:hypothetical protein [Agathobaculum desmolans]|uniref:hypothetical protein n=1 Tax=Agathobaculum desmolans TaxID=39484 RepID=UPI00248EB498|nr:hypothetical protein [Agathobaculum desmolans]